MKTHRFSAILLRVLAVLAFCCSLLSAQADMIKMKNGRTVEGNVVVVGGGYVVVERNGIQVSLQQSEVIPPDLNKMTAEAERLFEAGDIVQSEKIARKVLIWDKQQPQAKALVNRIQKIHAEALAKAEAARADQQKRLDEAQTALEEGNVQRARDLATSVLNEDAESTAALALMPEIEEAAKAADEKAEVARLAREQAIQDASSALLAQDVGKAINAARPAIMETPKDPRVQSLLQEIGKAAGEKLAKTTTTTLQNSNVTQNDLQVLVNQANTLAQGGGSQISTATLSGILTGLADFIAPPRPESFDASSTETLSGSIGDGSATSTLSLPAEATPGMAGETLSTPPSSTIVIPGTEGAPTTAVTPVAPTPDAAAGFAPPAGAIENVPPAPVAPPGGVAAPAAPPAPNLFAPPAAAIGNAAPTAAPTPTSTPAFAPPPPGAAVTPSTPAVPATPPLPAAPGTIPSVPGL